MRKKTKHPSDDVNDDMASGIIIKGKSKENTESNNDLAIGFEKQPDDEKPEEPVIEKEIINELKQEEKNEATYIKPASIVIPYVNSTALGDELKYAVRSIALNAGFPFKLFIVADRLPDWASDELLLIEAKQVVGQKYAKAFDAVEKLKAAVGDERVDDLFIYSYDDTVFLSKVASFDFLNVAVAQLSSPEKIRAMKSGSTIWKEVLSNTFERLKANKLPTFNYETHLPRLFEKKRISTIIKKFGFQRRPYLFSTIYFNYFNPQPEFLLNGLPLYKADIREPLAIRQIEEVTKGKLFLNYNDKGLNVNLKEFLSEKFPEKSRFEK